MKFSFSDDFSFEQYECGERIPLLGPKGMLDGAVRARSFVGHFVEPSSTTNIERAYQV